MIFLYTALLLLVGVAHFLIKRRVAALEKKYSGVVKEADDLLRQGNHRDGNSNRQDPYQNAKRQYKLAMLAEKRDRMETQLQHLASACRAAGQVASSAACLEGP